MNATTYFLRGLAPHVVDFFLGVLERSRPCVT
jgi:hypothetical protein